MDQDSLKQSFLDAFDEYSDAIFRFCVVKTSSAELAEDLTQDTFMRFWQALRNGKEMTNSRSYLYTIANNLVIDWYRKKKSDSLDTKMEGGFQVADRQSLSSEAEAAYAEIVRNMQELSEGDAEVLVMRFVDGLEPRDIAEIIGESANTVSVRINRAVKRLQQQLHV
ncbi:MAG: RNA polymerase sigma factor [Candidatus Paceibacterota bacterium]